MDEQEMDRQILDTSELLLHTLQSIPQVENESGNDAPTTIVAKTAIVPATEAL